MRGYAPLAVRQGHRQKASGTLGTAAAGSRRLWREGVVLLLFMVLASDRLVHGY